MARFICVYYTTTDVLSVHKSNKRVKVIDADLGINVAHKLKEVEGITLIQYIRDLEKDKPLFVNEELKFQENKNNDNFE